MTLTFIGNGEMARAMISGLADTYDIEIIGRNKKKLEELAEFFSEYNIVANSFEEVKDIDSKNIILCVKPSALADVSKKLSGTANSVLSILTGTSLEKLKKNIKSTYYVRAMPNIAAAFGKSITTFTGDPDFKESAEKILSSIGRTIWLDTEKEINASVAIAACAPAFLTLIAESLIDASVAQGLKRVDAQEIAKGLFDSFGTLINKTHPTLIRDNVMSPGGATAAGYGALERNQTRKAIWEAVEKSCEKSF